MRPPAFLVSLGLTVLLHCENAAPQPPVQERIAEPAVQAILNATSTEEFRENVSGPICGLLCVEGAFVAVEKSPPKRELLFVPKYIGSREGSSASELVSAARDFGLQAFSKSNLTVANLRDTDCPMILHFRHSVTGAFNHWVLFLGFDEGRIRIADLPSAPANISTAELLAMWDGTAVFIHANPNGALLPTWLSWIVFAVAPSVLFAVLLLLASRKVVIEKWNCGGCRPITVFSILAVASLVVTIVRHVLMPDGFIQNQTSLSLVRQHMIPVDALDGRLVAQLPETANQYLFVDSRYPSQFAAKHVEQAVNIPVYATLAERREILKGISKSKPVLVYCNGPKCGYSEYVARMLVADGFENVCILEEYFEKIVELTKREQNHASLDGDL